MDAESWIATFAAELGVEPPSGERVDELLRLAAVAAHSSERIAAPVACWLAGNAGIEPERAIELAESLGEPG